jgi:membrane protein required for colicin V production
VLACWNYALLAHVFFRWISSTNIANALAFLLIALGVMLVAGMVGGLLRKVVHGVGLGWMDRLMGAVFGVLRGCLLVTVAIIAVLAFRPGALWMHQSTLVPYFLPGARVLSAQAPRELKEKIIWGANLLKHSRVTWVQ